MLIAIFVIIPMNLTLYNKRELRVLKCKQEVCNAILLNYGTVKTNYQKSNLL